MLKAPSNSPWTLKPRSLGDTLSVRLNRLVRLLEAVSARLNPLVLRWGVTSSVILSSQLRLERLSQVHIETSVGWVVCTLECRSNLSCAPIIPHSLCQWMVPCLVLTHTHRFLQTTLSLCDSDSNFNLLSRNTYLLVVEVHLWKPALRISLCICRIFIFSPFSFLNNFILIKRSRLSSK